MARNEESPFRGLVLSWPALGAFLVAVWGLIIARPPLESPRPTFPPGARPPGGERGSVPARLWQDPLAAVLDQTADEPPQALAQAFQRPVNDLVDDPPEEYLPQKLLFLMVCINPQKTPEYAESRRRQRYATLSALSTARYAPDQAEKISYVKLPRHLGASPALSASITSLIGSPLGQGPLLAASALLSGRTSLVDPVARDGLLIPYEVVRPIYSYNYKLDFHERTRTPYYDAVFVLWLGDNLGKDYGCLGKLGSLWRVKETLENAVKCSGKQDQVSLDFAITGQLDSTELDALLKEDDKASSTGKPLDGVTLHVTASTAPFVRSIPMQSNTGLSVEYLIGTDDQLANALMEELRRRGIHPERGDCVALIAEWDTDYGRNMFEVFDSAARSGNPKAKLDLQLYSYLRGLDGKLLGESKSGLTEEKAANPSGAKETQATVPTSKEVEGDPQIDYLRRLVERMNLHETSKLHEMSHSQTFRAIGVVGSDVYDKILLLKALRPRFPEAVFFTTDLDARLLQPGDYSYLRNLLIASHFGLALNEELQGKIAPFRSGYDTASYLGVLRAVKYEKEKLDDLITVTSDGSLRQIKSRSRTAFRASGASTVGLIGSPLGQGPILAVSALFAGRYLYTEKLPVHLYEVGRSGAYELTLYDPDDDPLGSENPRRNPWITRDGRHWLLLGGLLLVAVVLYPLSRPWQAFVRSSGALLAYPVAQLRSRSSQRSISLRRSISRFQLVAFVAATLTLVLVGLSYASHVSKDGEPFEIFEGLSIWPTVVLRFLASVLCLYYVLTALKDLRVRDKKIRKDFFFAHQKGSEADAGPAPSGVPVDLGEGGASAPGWSVWNRGVRPPARQGLPKSTGAPEPSPLWRRLLWNPLRDSWREWTWNPKNPDVYAVWNQFKENGREGRRCRRCLLLSAAYFLLFVLLWIPFDHGMVQARGSIAQATDFTLRIVTGGMLIALLVFVVDCTLLCQRLVIYLSRYAQ
jgi:hypothetical protein